MTTNPDPTVSAPHPARRLLRSGVFGLACGVAALPPYDRLSRRAWGLAIAGGALAAGGAAAVAVGTGRGKTPDLPPAPAPDQEVESSQEPNSAGAPERSPLVLGVVGLAGALAGAGSVALSLVADRATVRFLGRRGVKRPRLSYAAGSAVLGGVMEFFDTTRTRSLGA